MTLDQWRARYEELDAETARLRVELDAARADAERYRHIRTIGKVHLADATMNGVYYHIRYVQHFIEIKPLDIVDHNHRFDAAVDSAMAAKEKG